MTKLGGWITTGSIEVAAEFARAGFDFLCFDLQHGSLDVGGTIELLIALDHVSVPKYVRLAYSELQLAPRMLDFGADGVIVANVETRDQMQHAVRALKYPPDGARSYGGFRSRRLRMNPAEVQPSAIAMIETEAAFAGVDAIAGVDGVDGLFLGPADLGLALGFGLGIDVTDERWAGVLRRFLGAAVAHTVSSFMLAKDGADACIWRDEGFTHVVVASDLVALSTAITRDLAVTRGASDRNMS